MRPRRLSQLVVDMAEVNPDPAYVARARHLTHCRACAESGELDPEHLCWWGRILLWA